MSLYFNLGSNIKFNKIKKHIPQISFFQKINVHHPFSASCNKTSLQFTTKNLRQIAEIISQQKLIFDRTR